MVGRAKRVGGVDDDLSKYEGDDDESQLRTDSVSEGSRRKLRREGRKGYYWPVLFIMALIGVLLGWGFSPRGFGGKSTGKLASIIPGSGAEGVASDDVVNESALNDESCDERRALQDNLSNMHGSADKKRGEPQIRRRLHATKSDKGLETMLPKDEQNELALEWWTKMQHKGTKSSQRSRKSKGLLKSKGLKSKGSKRCKKKSKNQESPSSQPSSILSESPSGQPSAIPSRVPSSIPSESPILTPSSIPSESPSSISSKQPSGQPSAIPSMQPSSHPSESPSANPSLPTLCMNTANSQSTPSPTCPAQPFGECYPDQYPASTGGTNGCKTCGTGKVPNENEDGCAWCDPGSVKLNGDGTGTADCQTSDVCLPASDFCLADEYAQNGKCRSCNTGKISKPDKTGCEWCTQGTVKFDRDGGTEATSVSDCTDTKDTICLSADGICLVDEYGGNGVCKQCSTGKVSLCEDPDKECSQTSPKAKTACEFCKSGTVRLTSDGTGEATMLSETYADVCLSADGICLVDEFGGNGVCRQCSTGKVSVCEDPDQACSQTSPKAKTACEFCKSGTVRLTSDGTGEATMLSETYADVCLPAKCLCTSTQIGKNGKCVECSGGKIANAEFTHCVSSATIVTPPDTSDCPSND